MMTPQIAEVIESSLSPQSAATRGSSGRLLTSLGAERTAPQPRWLDSVVERANIILGLQNNWDSYGAPAPSPHAVKDAVDFISLAAEGVPGLLKPDLFPCNDGAVSVQWEGKDYFIEVEFRAGGRIVFRVERGDEEFEMKYIFDVRPILENLHRYTVN